MAHGTVQGMPATRMVVLTTAQGAFHARVICARLGAEGIVTQLRGAVDPLYPVTGEVDVLVEPGSFDDAAALLLLDEAEAAVVEVDGDPWPRGRHPLHPFVALTVISAVLVGSVSAVLSTL